MSRLWRVFQWLRTGLLTLLALVISVLALVSALVATEPGSRWALQQVAQRLPQLELGTLSGNLLTGLDASYVDYQFEDQHYRVEGLSFRWQPLALLYSAVSVQSLRAESVYLQLPAGSDAEPEPVDEWQWPSLALPVRIELGQVALRNIRIRQGEQLTELHAISGSLSHGTFNLRVYDLRVSAEDYQVNAQGRIGLRYPYAAELALDWRYRLSLDEAEPLALAGRAQLEGDIEQLQLSHQLTAPVQLNTQVALTPNLADPARNPHVVLDSQWREQLPPAALWPLEQPAPLTSARLQGEGWLDDYRVQLQAEVALPELPSLVLDLNAQGDLSQLQVEQLQLQFDVLRLAGEGWLAWAEPASAADLSWALNLVLEGVDPALLLPDWPGEIHARAQSRGQWQAGELSASLSELVVSGQLRGLALDGRGDVSYTRGRIAAEQLYLALGANQLNVSGHMAEDFDLRWHLAAPILAQLDPALGGSLEVRGHLEGSPALPHLALQLQAQELRWQDEQIQQLTLSLDRDAQGHYQLQGAAEQLTLSEQFVEHLTLTGAGTPEQHQVRLALNGAERGALELALAGGYQDEHWRGQLTELELRLLELPRWRLLSSAPMTLSPALVELGAQCLTTRAERRFEADSDEDEPPETPALCLTGDWQEDTGLDMQAELRAVPLRLLRFWVKPEAQLSGVIEGGAQLRQLPGEPLAAELNLRTRDAEFRYQHGEEDLDVYVWRETRLFLTLQDQALQAGLVTDLGEYGRAEAGLDLNLASRALAGSLTASFEDLAPLEALIPRLHDLRGALNADLRLAGSLDQPQLLGQIRLRDASTNLPELGLELTAIEVTLDSADTGAVSLRGQLTSGPGQLNLSADLEQLGQPDWRLLARVEGENVEIIRDRQLQAQISPAITLNASAREIQVEGRARIPKALADIKTLPASATRVSDDVVLVNGRDNGAGGLGIPWRMNIRLQLGDDVRFQGFGLESRLSGELVLLRTPSRGLLTTGDVGVAEGVYRAYGQALTIERGRLIFQGPYDNPGLDIRAERTITNLVPEVTVGLEIGGTLQRPRSRIFSSPTQSDSEAMAMLLTGRPLSSSSSADASMLVNAIGTLGLERSNFITAEIAQTFRLDELTVQTGDNFEDSSLFIGKYLTPRLFVRYVVGLFGQPSTMGVRYQLTDGLRLEAESGVHQSVDMIYKFER